MPSDSLIYTLYRASTGASSFWRWEIAYKGRTNTPLKSGYFYGTKTDAKQRAEVALSLVAHTEKITTKRTPEGAKSSAPKSYPHPT
jgi:hypothetical protein